MRTPARLTVVGVSALLAAAGVGAAHAAWSPAAAQTAARASGGRPASSGRACVLTASAHTPNRNSSLARIAGHPHRTAGSGNLVVGIPRAVFVRSVGDRLVVTTNTGRPPRSRDTFYFIAAGHAGPASAAIRMQVTAGCA